MFAGSTRFNELRRGVPRMLPALLLRRLKELEAVPQWRASGWY
jgi:DNA-binding HxlR family transcriptional regulator